MVRKEDLPLVVDGFTLPGPPPELYGEKVVHQDISLASSNTDGLMEGSSGWVVKGKTKINRSKDTAPGIIRSTNSGSSRVDG